MNEPGNEVETEYNDNLIEGGGGICIRHEDVKLFTFFKTQDPKSDTLLGGTVPV